MLVSFSVSNFRSFSVPEETISLVASKRLANTHETHTIPIPGTDENVLKTAVIYGANGAGKSNLFKAIQFMKGFALKTKKKNTGTGRKVFRFSNDSNYPTTFDLQFIAGGELYRYGFKIDDKIVIDEWFVKINSEKEYVIYERTTDESGQVNVVFKLKELKEKLKALATIGGPQNQTFLATIAATIDEVDINKEIKEVISWFADCLRLISPNTSYGRLGHLLDTDNEFLKFAGDFLNSSSTGVSCLKPYRTEVSEDELRKILPKKDIDSLLDDLADDKGSVAYVLIGVNRKTEILIERTDENHYYKLSIQSVHEHKAGEKIELDLEDESDGTRRLLNLLPALYSLRKGDAVFFIDEIDRSMHPILAKGFLEFFLNSCDGGNRQIIVTTHESNLLDLELLRRDEVWFTEKDSGGASHLYSLSDFKVRDDLEVRKHYLNGRFGAIPFLGNLNALLNEKNSLT